MSEYSYIRLNRFMHAHPAFSKAAVILCKAITALIYLFYPAFLVYLFFAQRQFFLRLTVVPFMAIVLVSFFRSRINLPRPYEKMDITPLYDKQTKGCSFPSRHTFAVFMIAFSAFNINIPLGIIISFMGLVLAVLRIILGVHYVRDVLAGFLCAIISAVIGYVAF